MCKERRASSNPGQAAKGKAQSIRTAPPPVLSQHSPQFPQKPKRTFLSPPIRNAPLFSRRPLDCNGAVVARNTGAPKSTTKLRSSPNFSCFWLAPSSFVLQPVTLPAADAFLASSPLPGQDETRVKLEFAARANAAQSVGLSFGAAFAGCVHGGMVGWRELGMCLGGFRSPLGWSLEGFHVGVGFGAYG
ncbi:hypothetical protein BP5796_10260 [Coleophoma crateriformis]|uniref:Uncharacterized protein n=1 Tax=Coleophoma crateriformis TaxID=565419 RepID=A0A3D8QV47_9HELO|nr:hypothetical protein BP5796_10260 [Coleophoma crateriformis]